MSLGDIKGGLYRGQQPNWIAWVLNRVDAALASSAIAPNYLVTLEVIGRKSGRGISPPVAGVVVGWQHYLVSMLREIAQWVHNVRAAHGKVALLGGGREAVQLEEILSDKRAPILKAYLQRAPGARPHMPVN